MSDVSDCEEETLPTTNNNESTNIEIENDDVDTVLGKRKRKPETTTSLPLSPLPQQCEKKLKPSTTTTTEEEEEEPPVVYYNPYAQRTSQSDINDEEDVLYVKTVNVEDFCTVISACCEVPGMKYVVFSFMKEGMQLYASSFSSPYLAQAFFHRDMFTEYKLKDDQPVNKLFPKDQLEPIQKQIKKNVQWLEITSYDQGYRIRGPKLFTTGTKALFSTNLINIIEDCDIVDMSCFDYSWQVNMASANFKESSDFHNKTKYSVITINSEKINFTSNDENGFVKTSIVQELKTPNLTTPYQGMFMVEALKPVTVASSLNKTVIISFEADETENVKPLMFQYVIDHNHKPASHLTYYIAPCNVEDSV